MPRELKTVADVMTHKLATVAEHDVLHDIDDAMHRLRVRHFPVVDSNGRLVGLLSRPDVMTAGSGAGSEGDGRKLSQMPVASMMQREVLTVQPDDPLVEAGKLIWEAKTGCLPVVDPTGVLVGIITEADFVALAVELLGGHITKKDVEQLAREPRVERAPLPM